MIRIFCFFLSSDWRLSGSRKPTENRARKTHRKLKQDRRHSPVSILPIGHTVCSCCPVLSGARRLSWFSLELQQVEEDHRREEVAGAPGHHCRPVHIVDRTRTCSDTGNSAIPHWCFYLCGFHHHLLFPSIFGWFPQLYIDTDIAMETGKWSIDRPVCTVGCFYANKENSW